MLDTPKKHRPRIGAILLEYDLITQEQLARALKADPERETPWIDS
ncbi:MAG: hypothetical protein ABFR82_05770 [Nitrospirota bacterium]